MKPRKELPDPGTVLDDVTTFVTLVKDGAYMAGDRRVHHTERSKWRLTFRRCSVMQVPEVAPLPPSARKIHAERAATQALIEQAYQAGRLPSG